MLLDLRLTAPANSRDRIAEPLAWLILKTAAPITLYSADLTQAVTRSRRIPRPHTPALWSSTSIPSCATARSEGSDLCRLAHVEGMQHDVAHECAERARPGWRACRGVARANRRRRIGEPVPGQSPGSRQ